MTGIIDQAAQRHSADAIGRMLMVGVRGATSSDPALRADLEACRAARCRAVILFDVDLPGMESLRSQGVPAAEARARATRNVISPTQVAELSAHIRETLGPDTIIGIDQEGGRVARLSVARGFDPSPSAHAFARMDEAAQNTHADALARGLARAGVNLNFAPCTDLASNPDNPVIARLERALSDDPDVVARCAVRIVHAHRDAGVLPCLKHFPGHGSASADSHFDLPDITDTFDPATDLLPYRVLFALRPHTALWVMTAHLLHRGIDPGFPASLSFSHTTALLREELEFDGVIVTDSLDMQAVAANTPPHEAALLAINAGADMALDGNNAPGPSRDCPAPLMAETIARALRDHRIPGGPARLHASGDRIARSLRTLRPGT